MMVIDRSHGRVERVEWPVMGTVAAVQTRGGSSDQRREAMDKVKAAFAEVERLLNAHDPNSELSRLAALPDAEVLANCNAEMRPCYEMAFELMRQLGGAFNPRWRGPGTLDLGAIAKGFAVDRAAAAVPYPQDFDLLIDLGGNLFAVKGSWRVGVMGSDKVIDLHEGGACATSAEYFRGKHIRDGRTGAVVSNGVASVTVMCAGSAMRADGLSTALFVLGPDAGGRFLDEKWRDVGDAAAWFMADGRRIERIAHADEMPRASR